MGDVDTGSRRLVDQAVVDGFGYEWSKFDQSSVDAAEAESLFSQYFALFPWDALAPEPVGFDLGCGSGRWARMVAPRAGVLVGVDASGEALRVASANAPRCPMVQASAGALPFRPSSMDFGYSLGVLHHVPDPLAGLRDAVTALTPGAPFLVTSITPSTTVHGGSGPLWRGSDVVRRAVSRWPAPLRYAVGQLLAVLVYLPLARTARFFERRGHDVEGFPLSAYRRRSMYAMRTDALDRFATGRSGVSPGPRWWG